MSDAIKEQVWLGTPGLGTLTISLKVKLAGGKSRMVTVHKSYECSETEAQP